MGVYNLLNNYETTESRALMLKAFGWNIKNIRLTKGFTQEEVAAKAGIATKYLGEIERGKKNPTAQVVYKISQALNTPITAIFPNEDCSLKTNLLKEVERLFDGKDDKEVQKAMRLLRAFFE